MSKLLDHNIVSRLFRQSIAGGGLRRSLSNIEWEIAGNCESPVARICYARPAQALDRREIIIDSTRTAVPLQVSLDVRCRKCRNCLTFRRRLWTAKAVVETRISERTWFATFTFSQPRHDEIRDHITLAMAKGGSDFDLLSEEEQFKMRHNRCSKFLTLWLKRIRKNSGARLRYIMVCEAHKSNLPHYHALIHETEIESRVTKQTLENAWPYGFTNFKLLPEFETSQVSYACKYLSKNALARVRASQHYGTVNVPKHGATPEKIDPPFNLSGIKQIKGD